MTLRKSVELHPPDTTLPALQVAVRVSSPVPPLQLVAGDWDVVNVPTLPVAPVAPVAPSCRSAPWRQWCPSRQ